MKKVIAFLLTVVLCMGMSVNVFAANSPSVDNTNKLPSGSTTINGQPVQVEVKTLASAVSSLQGEQKTEAERILTVVNSGDSSAITTMQKELIKKVTTEEAPEIGHSKLVDVQLPSGTSMPAEGVSITFSDSSIKAGMNIVMLHLKADGTWEKIATTVSNGTIVGVFTSLSPVYYFELKEQKENVSVYRPADIEFTGDNGKAMRWISSNQDINFSVSASQATIPEGASFDVAVVNDVTVASAVKTARGNVDFVAYDFTLEANGSELTRFNETITIGMPIPSGLELEDGQTVSVYYYNNGKLEKCSSTIIDGFVHLYTTHLSTFVYVAESASAAAATPVTSGKVSPKTAENNMALYVSLLAVAAVAGTVYSMKKREDGSF